MKSTPTSQMLDLLEKYIQDNLSLALYQCKAIKSVQSYLTADEQKRFSKLRRLVLEKSAPMFMGMLTEQYKRKSVATFCTLLSVKERFEFYSDAEVKKIEKIEKKMLKLKDLYNDQQLEIIKKWEADWVHNFD
tara:strand:+ start:261 stop:659 length:399 start_codon:yes stop_codon:yes gene_type:complete